MRTTLPGTHTLDLPSLISRSEASDPVPPKKHLNPRKVLVRVLVAVVVLDEDGDDGAGARGRRGLGGGQGRHDALDFCVPQASTFFSWKCQKKNLADGARVVKNPNDSAISGVFTQKQCFVGGNHGGTLHVQCSRDVNVCLRQNPLT